MRAQNPNQMFPSVHSTDYYILGYFKRFPRMRLQNFGRKTDATQ